MYILHAYMYDLYVESNCLWLHGMLQWAMEPNQRAVETYLDLLYYMIYIYRISLTSEEVYLISLFFSNDEM